MKRREMVLGAAAAAAIGPAAMAQTTAPPKTGAPPKTIALWHIYSLEADIIHIGIRNFNAGQSEYRIEQRILPYTELNPELIRAIATGAPPDLTVINDPDVAGYASQGELTDITERVAQSRIIEPQKFFPGPRNSDHWKGRQYSVAREVNTLSLYYNVDQFRAKGLDPDKPPATWSELAAAAAKLTDPGAHVFGIGFCAHQSEQSTFQWMPFLLQAGGSFDKLDRPEATAALQLWTDFVSKGHASRDVINQQQSEVLSSFLAGNYAMAVGGPWDLPRSKDAKFEWRVATLPVKDDKKIAASSLGGFHLAIPKGARQVDGAFKVIEAMLDPAIFTPGWNVGGVMAPRTDIEVAHPSWPQAYATFRAQLPTAVQRGPHPQWSTLSRAVQTAIQEALTGTKPPAAALAEAAQRIKPVLARTPL